MKRVVLCKHLDGHFKEAYKFSMAVKADNRFNFFFSPSAHLFAATYMAEISSNVA